MFFTHLVMFKFFAGAGAAPVAGTGDTLESPVFMYEWMWDKYL